MRQFSTMAICLACVFPAISPVAFSQQGLAPSESAASEIRFRLVEEPVDRKLFQAEKKLLEQTVVAHIQLRSLGPSPGQELFDAEELAPIRRLANSGDRTLLRASVRVPSEGERTMSEFLRAIAKSIPVHLRPKDEQLAFFLSEGANDGYVVLSSRFRRHERELLEFEVLAPNVEVAKERVATLVSLLQKGIADPVRQYAKAHQAELVSNVESKEGRLEEIRQSLDELKDKLSKSADIEAIELNRLKTQRQLFDVDIVGVRARIQAAEKIRKRYKDDMAVGKKLDDIKMAAEIDLAGLAASREALSEIIKRGEQSVHFENEGQRLREELDALAKRLRIARSHLERSREAVDSAESLFVPYQGEVTIYPIRWVQ